MKLHKISLTKRQKIGVSAAVILVVIVMAAGALVALRDNTDQIITKSPQKIAPKPPTDPVKPTRISLVATGDWIAHDSVNAQALQANGSYSYGPMIADVKSYFAGGDVRFCNDPILNGGAALGVHGYPKFNSPTDFVSAMGTFGCNLVNLASNHSFDYTQANIDASVVAWKQVPAMLAVAGENASLAERDAVHVFEVKGVKMAFLAYTTYINADAPAQNNYGVNVYSPEFAKKQIDEAKAQGAKVVIASMRWGTEFSSVVTAQQQAQAQFLADNGVAAVLGHGPHQLQSVATLTGATGAKTVVWYSLGNFLNTQIPAETLFNGLAYMQIDPNTYAVTIKGYLPLYMHYEWSADQAKAQAISSRSNLHLYLLSQATQALIDSQQLSTSVAAQQARITNTLQSDGVTVPLLTPAQAKTNN